MKRPFDIIVAATGIVVLAPLLLTIAVLVRVVHGSPVLFRQQRAGIKGEPFRVVKFRTMRNCSNAVVDPIQDGKRLTTLGRALRASSLDELPTLWNVLRGDMSLVGPRPLLMEYLPLYTDEQRRRHDVRPGITGWAQVNGRNELTWEEKFALDVWYVDNRSFVLDLRILWMTVGKVLISEGISQSGTATAEPFRGSR